METVIRVVIVYVFIMAALRMMGKREFGELAPFDLVVLLLIPELVTQGINRSDQSLTHAMVAVATLLTLVFATSLLSYRFKRVENVLSFTPAVLVRRGSLVQRNLDHERVLPAEVFDALHQAGLHRLAQVQWAILESDGKITIIPAQEAGERQTEDEQGV